MTNGFGKRAGRRFLTLALPLLLLSGCVSDGGSPTEMLARSLETVATGLRSETPPAASRTLSESTAERGLQRVVEPQIASTAQQALVIGNAAYEYAPLANPVNDARAMAAVLEEKGFEVMLRTDLGYAAMEQALRGFGQRLRARKGVGLVYFAGHGVQVDGDNYLIPVNNDRIRDGLAVKDYALALNQIDRRLRAAGNAFNMIILDACRDNPFPATTRSLSRGLSEPPSARGRLIGFATDPGDVAADASGAGNSPYTAALVETIREPGLEVEDVFKRVYRKVASSTNGRQQPWFNASFTGRYCFGGCETPNVVARAPEPQSTEPAASTPEPDTTDTEALAAELERQRRETERLQAEIERERERQEAERLQAELERQQQEAERLRAELEQERAREQAERERQQEARRKAAEAERLQAELERQRREAERLQAERERLAAQRRQNTATARTLRDRLRDGSQGPELVRIEPGCFMMGSPASESGRDDDERRHRVCIEDAFYMGKTEVTFEQYDRFARATGRDLPRDRGWGRGTRPVITVDWHDAVAYAEWLSEQTGEWYRLPTEAEWEYAARAGTETRYWWGDAIGINRANCHGCGSRWDAERTAPAGSFDPNPWGVHDMAGNVWEWTCSEYDGSYGSTEDRCTSNNHSNAKNVFRGGSWLSDPRRVRSANRDRYSPDTRDNYLGFRLARSP